jgi:hypothetical protein
VPPQFTSPPGYDPVASAVNAMKGMTPGIFKMFQNHTLEGLMGHGLVFAGNPDSVYRQIVKMHEHVRGFGQLLMMSQAGFLDHEETVKGMRMFAREVYPRPRKLRWALAAEEGVDERARLGRRGRHPPTRGCPRSGRCTSWRRHQKSRQRHN